MPVDSHLSWAEIRDFTPGLWTVGDQNMPSSAAQSMIDCYGLPAGGLRAWFKPATLTTSGVVNIAQERIAGLYIRGGIPHRTLSGVADDRYMLTWNSTDTFCRLYRMDLTTAAVTTWTLIKTFATGGAPRWGTFTTVHLASGADHVYVSIFASSADDGVWSVDYSTGAVAKVVASPWAGPITQHQSRLLVSHSSLGEFTFSDPSLETGLGTNIVTVDTSRDLGTIYGICSLAASDLLVQKNGAPFYLVEGDLTNFTLRQMNDSKATGGWNSLTFGPQGVIFACTGDGLYETPDGSIMNPLSKQLAGQDVIPQNNLSTAVDTWSTVTFIRHWLIMGNGTIYDYDTHCFFKSSFMQASTGGAMKAERFNHTILAGTGGLNFSLMVFGTNEGTSNRCESWTWKSAPLRDPVGRQVEVRSIQVYARSRNGATSTITLTVNGVAQTLACDSSGRGGLTFYLVQRREELDIQIDSLSNQVGVEAPLVEAIRVGSQSGHFLRPVADVG